MVSLATVACGEQDISRFEMTSLAKPTATFDDVLREGCDRLKDEVSLIQVTFLQGVL